uniref:Uncharacterized protein n=1 Tax=Candidatus Giovannonibacteria bacterium GW2011_GWF2_42_19 TaxID=1618659 RepID=A0A0G0ZJH0_9BACT|nr:MAG: hypothetical protein UV11_C0001G0032 [Candidatus Giovannonibacteria bacterium GW2011_GWF2_42_19]
MKIEIRKVNKWLLGDGFVGMFFRLWVFERSRFKYKNDLHLGLLISAHFKTWSNIKARFMRAGFLLKPFTAIWLLLAKLCYWRMIALSNRLEEAVR